MAKSDEPGQSAPTPKLLVEVQPRSNSGDLSPRVTSPEEFHRRAGELAESVVQVAEEFRSKLARALSTRSHGLGIQSVEIEFGIALQAETGIVIAKATAGTTFIARLTLGAGSSP